LITKLMTGLAAAVFAAFVSLPLRGAVMTYSITDLGTLPGMNAASAAGINNAGQIVGNSVIAGNGSGGRGFLKNGAGPMQTLGVPATLAASANSIALAINNVGQIAGEAIPAGATGPVPPWRTYLIPAGGTFATATDIGTLGGNFTFANGINDAGKIVGRSGWFMNFWHAYVYTPGSGMMDLTPDAPYAEAMDINNIGQVVGSTGDHSRAFRTAPGQTVQPQDDLGTLGGTYIAATAINNAGRVAGRSTILGNDSVSHAFRTRPNLPINPATDDLGGLSNHLTEPYDINEVGDVVGWSQLASLNFHAFISYGDSNAMYDLNNLIPAGSGWELIGASAINEQGVIVGWGNFNGGDTDHAFMLTPLPEPAGGIALVLIGGMAWGRRRAHAITRGSR
jgi:probable HAF family extracellular repeat protein